MTAPLSVVIPTLNSGDALRRTIAALNTPGEGSLALEVIVVDGGSNDATTAVAASLNARVLEAPASRGGQLAIGGEQARGEWLLFLHADTLLEDAWEQVVTAFIQEPANQKRAAVFQFALDDPDPRARRVERITRWRNRVLGLPYGDQGLLIHKAFYRNLGGFSSYPLMEDVDIVRRIGRKRILCLPATATTSAARYRRDGWWMRPLRNLTLLTLFSLGAPPRLLTRLY
ncbi:TIGR04283 family arsenosugar biosynthesis glycosyltransferase [Pelagibius sp. Alg239-R121]|uniref:TIGR04283 family arsenosugar biosynthesis glycosyltransferase n=1 Tax=Pelagibius sp. Alg239-R121 TaxID=2993448 RepID=UPI0024A773A0|nr:TIGR04283 family arsenosugar biosynthesis glycosyltransferase [Pelagibius sp. Alg239-R121]